MRLVVVALGVWFAVLNLLTAAADLPLALSGRRVEVTVRSCQMARSGLRTCVGDYRLGPVFVIGRSVLGGDTLREGTMVRATVPGDAPGDPSIADPRLGVGEAALFAFAGLVTAAMSIVALRRRLRRGLAPRPLAPVGPAAAGDAGKVVEAVAAVDPGATVDDDPLAWVRRRRFGAGRT